MKVFLTISILFLAVSSLIESLPVSVNDAKSQYLALRNELMSDEAQLRTAATVALNSDEQLVNQKLMELKLNEINSYANGSFPPSIHLFQAKPLIEKSAVFSILKTVPKGGNLHLHSISMVDINWVIANATYDIKLYTCYSVQGQLFHFFANASVAAQNSNQDCTWLNVVQLRNSYSSSSAFDSSLYANLTIIVDNPAVAYPDINTVWQKFQRSLNAVNGMAGYIPFYIQYLERALEELLADNIQYAEFRTTLDPLYDDEGNVNTNKTYQVELIQTVVNDFVAKHPKDFIGAKVIYCALRHQDPSVIATALSDALQLRIQFPDFFAGFDLVGQEDPGYPLIYYLDQFIASQAEQAKAGVVLPYFFHAGETNEINGDTDNNLFDALMLNTTRIGHGYAVSKHPVVVALIGSKQVAVEVCPISNQVLKLVEDLRNHPASMFLELNVPMVINSDDPSVWGLTGLSYDYYEVFMGFGGNVLDLKTIKQLAINSIYFSALTVEEKQAGLNLWNAKWNTFIANAKSQLL